MDKHSGALILAEDLLPLRSGTLLACHLSSRSSRSSL